MSKLHNEVQSFRHRGYEGENGDVLMIYGNEADPVGSDGNPLKKLWDHDVSSTRSVQDHVQVEAPQQ